LLTFCVVLLLLNPSFIVVIHYSTGMLPVVSYATYSTLETNLIYIVMVLVSLSIIFSISERHIKIKKNLLKMNPMFATLLILSIFLNPHLFIIEPSGNPTRLDYLNFGATFLIILLIALIIINILYIIRDKSIKKYLINLGIFIVALWISEFIHESGHAIFALISGGQITAFMPFPTLIGNEINAGYVFFEGVPLNLQPLVLLGGEILQWTTVIVVIFLLYFRKWSYSISILLKSLLIVSWLDFPLYTLNNTFELPHWFILGSSHGDIIIISTLTEIPMLIFLIIAVLQLASGLFIFFYLKIFRNPFINRSRTNYAGN
jgi:hypothetical protein